MARPDLRLRPPALRRRAPDQSAALIAALAATLTERDDGPALARRIGEHMAATAAPPGDDTLQALERALNDGLAALDLGSAELKADTDSLAIAVRDYPAVNDQLEGAEAVVIGLFEGLLTAYLNGLSRSDDLAARLARLPGSPSEALEFRYARQAR